MFTFDANIVLWSYGATTLQYAKWLDEEEGTVFLLKYPQGKGSCEISSKVVYKY